MNIEKSYIDVMDDIILNGNNRGDRTGTGTRGIFGVQLKHNMSEGFPLLTTKKMATKQIISELLWFMRGQTDLRTLFAQKNYIWLGDAYKNYITKEEENYKILSKEIPNIDTNLETVTRKEFIDLILTDDKFNSLYGDLGKIYGKQWRSVTKQTINHYEAYNKYLSNFKNDIWSKMNYNTNFKIRKPYSFLEFYKIVENIDNSDYIMINDFGDAFTVEAKFSEIYGYKKNIDQLNDVVNQLKTNPTNRRIIVNAWNVAELDECVLPPCHMLYQFYSREITKDESLVIIKTMGLMDDFIDFMNLDSNNTYLDFHKKFELPFNKLSLQWYQRSADYALGVPFNIASYGILLHIIAFECGMIPDELIGCFGDTHLYSNHIETAKEQVGMKQLKLPTIKFSDDVVFGEGLDVLLNSLKPEHITFDNYEWSSELKFELSN